MNLIQNTEVNQNEPDNDSALTVDIQEVDHWGIPDRKTRKQWYQSTNPQIRSYITGNLATNISGKGARSLKRAADEYQYLSEDLARNSYSSRAMSKKYDNFNGIDSSLLDKALENENKQLDIYQQQFNTGQLSERKFNRLQRKHGRRINNLNENYRTLSEVWHNKHGIPLVRTQSSVSSLPFLLGTIGLPASIIGGVWAGTAAAPALNAVLSNPITQGYFAYHSANHLASDNGVKKTIDHFSNGETKKGLLSAMGDAVDLAAIGFGASSVTKAGKKLINKGIQQARAIQAAESALLNQKPQTVQVAGFRNPYKHYNNEIAYIEDIQRSGRLPKIESDSKIISTKGQIGQSSSTPTTEKINLDDFIHLTDDQWDDMYFRAIESGDNSAVQKIRDAHFLVKAPNTKAVDVNGNPVRVFHGEKDSPLYHDLRYLNRGPDRKGLGVYYSSSSPKIAQTYATFKGGDTGKVREVYYNIENPTVVDAEGRSFQSVLKHTDQFGRTSGVSTDDLVRKTYWEKTPEGFMKKSDKDGIIIRNVEDHAPGWTGTDAEAIADNYVTWNPTAVKSAEAIVRNPNTGEIIPISKRDNFKIPSTLMGIAPFIIGPQIIKKTK